MSGIFRICQATQRCVLQSARRHNISSARCFSSAADPQDYGFKSFQKKWKDTAETVIVGGGAVGASIAYHLAKKGQQDVVLLEKTELTAGSTWHAAGLTTSYHPNVHIRNLHHYSLQLYQKLEEETGQAVGLHMPGSVRIAQVPDRVDEFRYQITRQHWAKAPARLIWPDEIAELVPLMKMDNVLAGLLTPGDGHIDPYSLTQALAIGARKYGADIYQQSPVTAMNQREDGTWDVTTPKGTMRANRVIIAAGFHARDVGKLIGLDFPLVPIHHQYVVTKTVPEVSALKREIPVVRDLEGSYYLRMERDGLLFGPYERPEKMDLCDDWYIDGVPPGFGKELFQPNLDRIMECTECAMDLFPVLQTAEIQQVVSGPITYTPDVLPMAGPYPGQHNLWTAIGFGYGIVHAGGIGNYLANWILDGEPPHELIELDPGRFGKWTDQNYVLSKARETYGLNNLLAYPKEERPAGRPTSRTTPIYEKMLARGAEMGFHTGWEQPNWFALPGDEAGYKPSFRRTNWFEPVRRECEMVMNRAGIVDVTPFGKIEVKGPDACTFIDRIAANSVPKVGVTNISHMLTPRGNVFSELTITQMEPNHFFCITGSASEKHDQTWMEDHARQWGLDVHIESVTEDWAALGLAGPKSRDVLAKLTDADLSNENYPFLAAKNIEVAGLPVRALRISYTGELGWELYVEREKVGDLYEALLSAGEEHGVGDFGMYAMNSMRMEKGFRMWGAEMSVDQNPLEAGLGFFVKMKKKADFVGKDALYEIKKAGHKRQLVFMDIDTEDSGVDPEGNETVWHDNKVVGMTSSGAYGYTVNKCIAFAYVTPELSEPGSQVKVELLGKRYKAKVKKGPPLLIESMRERKHKK